MSELSKKIKHQWRGAMKKRREQERRLIVETAQRLLGAELPRPFVYQYEGKTYSHYAKRDW